MSDPQPSDMPAAVQPLAAPVGLDLLGDTAAGVCTDGFCALPTAPSGNVRPADGRADV